LRYKVLIREGERGDMSDNPIELEEEDTTEDLDDTGGISMIEPFDPTKINIQPQQDSLSNLIARLERNEIDMNTDFQRHSDLWNSGKMSRLIESIFIRFPLPAFYFDASDDDHWLIVDGLQRLSAIRKFVVDGRLRLSGLDFLKELQGKTYSELPRQFVRRINECPVTLFKIGPGTPPNVKYSVFKRINTGGLVLNNPEIRNAMARPRERAYLRRLAENEYLVKTMGDQSKRMMDQELVMRFIAFYSLDPQKSGYRNIAEFLDSAMEMLKAIPEKELLIIEEALDRSLKACFDIFGERAFEKRGKEAPKNGHLRENTSLFEAWTVEMAKQDDKTIARLIERRETVIAKTQALIDGDTGFYNSISLATQKRDYIRIRHEAVDSIIREVSHA
jgi:hypothetical protein